ncbi:MAG: HAMP domain-containing protein [Myxococcaceae bacterium]|nr:HAMP domain-containing protein [Myxococcaceae bacterium]
MRISTKLSVALALTSAFILSAYGVRQLLQEEADLQASAEHELKLLATAMQVAVENAWRDGQPADVREILESLELKDSAVDVLVFGADGHLAASSWGSGPAEQIAVPAVAQAAQANRPVTRFEGPRGLSYLVVALPLRSDSGARLGMLAVVRPLETLRQDLRATAYSTVLTIATVLATLIAVAWLLIQLHVRRPLSSLLTAIHSVRAGDLTASATESRDELGQIAMAFNAMVRELQTAQRKAAEETEARHDVEAGLARIDKLVTLGQLSAGLAHEIGSPLQVLNGRARALAARADVPADIRRTAEILAEQSDRITTIVEQLMSFARKKAPHMAPAHLGSAIAKVVELLEPEARRRGVRLSLSVEENLPSVPADAEQAQQVAMNLLTNALRATPKEGQVKVRVARATFSAQAGAAKQPSVSVTIENSGPVIAAQSLERIFEPFFTTWQDAGGTGLGLAVVRTIVTEHGGAVSVISDEINGTIFTAHFPQQGRGLKELVA